MIDLLISIRWPLIILQILICPILIGLILLQSGKGDDLGSALGGGGGGGNVAGTGGTSKVLVKATVMFAVIFMLNSIVLAKVYKELNMSSIGTSVSEPIAPGGSPEETTATEVLPPAAEPTEPSTNP